MDFYSWAYAFDDTSETIKPITPTTPHEVHAKTPEQPIPNKPVGTGRYGLKHPDGTPCDAKKPENCPLNKQQTKMPNWYAANASAGVKKAYEEVMRNGYFVSTKPEAQQAWAKQLNGNMWGGKRQPDGSVHFYPKGGEYEKSLNAENEGGAVAWTQKDEVQNQALLKQYPLSIQSEKDVNIDGIDFNNNYVYIHQAKGDGAEKICKSGQFLVDGNNLEITSYLVTSPDAIRASIDQMRNNSGHKGAHRLVILTIPKKEMQAYGSRNHKVNEENWMYDKPFKGLSQVLGRQYIHSVIDDGTKIDASTTTEQETLPQNNQASDIGYETAVNNGDENTAKYFIQQAAAKAMPNTVLKNQDGLPMVYSHVSQVPIKEFDNSRIGTHGLHGGPGFYFIPGGKEKNGYYHHYGDYATEAYIDLQNPIRIKDDGTTDRTITNEQIGKFVRQFALFGDDEKNIKGTIESISHGVPSSTGRPSFLYENRPLANDLDILNTLFSSIKSRWNGTQNRAFGDMIKVNTGYDGTLTSSGVPVVFNSNQIKSANVERDDEGNVIPLSKRFDMTSRDVRGTVN